MDMKKLIVEFRDFQCKRKTSACSIGVITFYLLRPHKLTNENQRQN
jgi:hypothetical protein